MALLVPRELGGAGASMSDVVADVCYTLGQACASTAMIVGHAPGGSRLRRAPLRRQHVAWRDFLRRIAAENLLLASSTTEWQRRWQRPLERAAPLVNEGGRLAFARAATVMSYGAEADAIVTTARRDADASASGDQALVVFLKQDYRADANRQLGHARHARHVRAPASRWPPRAARTQILPDRLRQDPSADHGAGLAPRLGERPGTGIAAAAVSRAQTLRAHGGAASAGGEMPPGASRCDRGHGGRCSALRGIVAAMLTRYEAHQADDPRACWALWRRRRRSTCSRSRFPSARSTTVVLAMRATGLAGYRNDGEFGLGRHLRDVLSAPIMVHNERILANIAATTLMSGVPTSLR